MYLIHLVTYFLTNTNENLEMVTFLFSVQPILLNSNSVESRRNRLEKRNNKFKQNNIYF